MSNHSTPPCLAFRQKISLEQQVQLHIFKEQVYGEGHSLARKDKKGWERVWFLMKGNTNYPKSNSKNYYHCRHFGINGKPGDQVHPFDKPLMHTRDSRVSKLSINLITSMLQLLAGRAENDLDIHVAYIPTSNSYNIRNQSIFLIAQWRYLCHSFFNFANFISSLKTFTDHSP